MAAMAREEDVSQLTESLRDQFKLNSVTDEVLRQIGAKALAENPFFPRVLSAVSDAITSRGEVVTIPSLFCGLAATFEKRETISNSQICAAVCGCLGVVVSHMPAPLLRIHAARLLPLYTVILKEHPKNHSILRRVLPSLPCILTVLDDSVGQELRSLGAVVVPLMVHAESAGNVRLAVNSVATILKMEGLSGVKDEICDQMERLGAEVVESPLQAAAAASVVTDSRKRSKLQDTLDAAVLSLVHFLSALARLIPYTTERFVQSVQPLLWKAFSIQLPEISAMACDVLKNVFSEGSHVPLELEMVGEMLQTLAEHVDRMQKESHELSIAFVEAIYSGLYLLQKQHFPSFLTLLAHILPAYLKQVLSEFEEVRERSKQNLLSLFSATLNSRSPEDVSFCERDMEQDTALSKICRSVESVLETDQEEALTCVLPVVGVLFQLLGRDAGSLANGILTKLDVLHESIDVEMDMEQGNEEKPILLKRVEEAIGSAITHLGTQSLLEALPLHLQEALEGSTQREPRTWLLPLIKKYARCDALAFWMEALFPAANLARQRVQEITSSDPELGFKCATLEKHIWLMLPSFSIWAYDIPSTFQCLSQILSETFVERSDLQDTIALAISRICRYPQVAAKVYKDSGEDMEAEDDHSKSASGNGQLKDIPKHYSFELTEASIRVLRDHSEKWFEIIASVVEMPDAAKGPSLLNALSELASISSPSVQNAIFTNTKNKLFQTFQDTSSYSAQQQIVYFDLLSALVSGLNSEGVEEIIKVVELVIQSDVSYQVQKKGYKILAHVLEHRPSVWMHNSQEMAKLLDSACSCCQPPSLQFRLRCLRDFLSIQAAQQPPLLDYNELVVTFLPELVLGLVDACSKAKEKSQESLLQIGQHYADSGRFDTLMVLLVEGLKSENASMIAGTVKGIQCLMESFGALFSEKLTNILQTILQLIHQKEEQMASSPMLSILLEFLQTAAQNLPVMVLGSYMKSIVGVLLEWEAPMKKAREQTKTLLMQLSERVGFEEVQKFVPENYSRVMRNLRKLHRRSASQMEPTEEGTRQGGASRTTRALTEKSKSQAASILKPGTTTERKSMLSKKSALSRGQFLKDADEMDETVDLLDPLENRKLAKAAAGQTTQQTTMDYREDDGFELPCNSEGKIVIHERSLRKAEKQWRKRRREVTEASALDDGMTLKSGTQSKKTIMSHGLQSRVSKATKTSTIKSHHSGKRFKSKKGAGGDVKGTSKVEPYAYWRLDRNLLNKRRGKRNAARKDLRRIGKGGRKQNDG